MAMHTSIKQTISLGADESDSGEAYLYLNRLSQSGLTKARVATEMRVGSGNACLSTARQAFKVDPVVNVSSTRRT